MDGGVEGGHLSGIPRPPSQGFPPAYWLIFLGLGLGLLVALAVGSQETPTFALLLVLLIPVGAIAMRVTGPFEPRWFPSLVLGAWAVKLLASTARYLALEVLYNGIGDATGYHNFGRRYAPIWRSLEVPPLGTGTEFMQAFTGLVYVPYIPTKLGGFLIFATMSFVGQVLLYLAFRHAFPSSRVKWYAILLFFFPNLLYWPSSIGKEAVMLLFIGVGAYGASRLFLEYRLRWLLVLALGSAGCAVVRSHMALLMVVSVTGVVLVARSPESQAARRLRLGAVAGVLVLSAVVVRYAVDDFGIDVSAGISETLVEEELDPIFGVVEEQTDRGGSAVEGGAIRSVADVPEALMRVVFRPLPTDAHNAQALANSILEGLFLLVLFIWRTPAILRNLPRYWRDPYLLFALLFTGGFIFGHSAVLNLGIVARQRSQAIPFILALLVELGWRPRRTVAPDGAVGPAPILLDSPVDQPLEGTRSE